MPTVNILKLDMACANGHIVIINELLKLNKDLINQQNADGQTPLHWAVLNNKGEVIDLLLKNQVNL